MLTHHLLIGGLVVNGHERCVHPQTVVAGLEPRLVLRRCLPRIALNSRTTPSTNVLTYVVALSAKQHPSPVVPRAGILSGGLPVVVANGGKLLFAIHGVQLVVVLSVSGQAVLSLLLGRCARF